MQNYNVRDLRSRSSPTNARTVESGGPYKPIEFSELKQMYDNTVQEFVDLLKRIDPAITSKLQGISKVPKKASYASYRPPERSRDNLFPGRTLQPFDEELDTGSSTGSTSLLSDIHRTEAPDKTEFSPVLAPILIELAANTLLPPVADAVGQYLSEFTHKDSDDTNQAGNQKQPYKIQGFSQSQTPAKHDYSPNRTQNASLPPWIPQLKQCLMPEQPTYQKDQTQFSPKYPPYNQQTSSNPGVFSRQPYEQGPRQQQIQPGKGLPSNDPRGAYQQQTPPGQGASFGHPLQYDPYQPQPIGKFPPASSPLRDPYQHQMSQGPVTPQYPSQPPSPSGQGVSFGHPLQYDPYQPQPIGKFPPASSPLRDPYQHQMSQGPVTPQYPSQPPSPSGQGVSFGHPLQYDPYQPQTIGKLPPGSSPLQHPYQDQRSQGLQPYVTPQYPSQPPILSGQGPTGPQTAQQGPNQPPGHPSVNSPTYFNPIPPGYPQAPPQQQFPLPQHGSQVPSTVPQRQSPAGGTATIEKYPQQDPFQQNPTSRQDPSTGLSQQPYQPFPGSQMYPPFLPTPVQKSVTPTPGSQNLSPKTFSSTKVPTRGDSQPSKRSPSSFRSSSSDSIDHSSTRSQKIRSSPSSSRSRSRGTSRSSISHSRDGSPSVKVVKLEGEVLKSLKDIDDQINVILNKLEAK